MMAHELHAFKFNDFAVILHSKFSHCRKFDGFHEFHEMKNE